MFFDMCSVLFLFCILFACGALLLVHTCSLRCFLEGSED